MQAVLLEMTSKRLGCVGFVNQNGDFTGMLTDGDLRRYLSASILDLESPHPHMLQVCGLLITPAINAASIAL